MIEKPKICSHCGVSIPGKVIGGLCPKCTAAFYLMGAPEAENCSVGGDGVSLELRPAKKRFQILERIGEGGMGEVLAAADAEIGRTVAIKRLKPDRWNDGSANSRFVAEARITGQLEHPGIVPIYELGVDADGRDVYTMRRVKGVTLAQILMQLKRRDFATIRHYPLPALLTIFQKVCDAVAYAHSRNVIHRDLKPDNVMVGEFGEAVVMDWGLAKVLKESENISEQELAGMVPSPIFVDHRTLDQTVLGSPGFMAPEQAEGRASECDERTDVFALGAILYSILTLHPPVRGETSQSIIERTKFGVIRPPTDFDSNSWFGPASPSSDSLMHCPNGRIPASLSAVVMKALAHKRGDRYASVQQFQADVAAYQNGYATSAEGAGLLTHLNLMVKRRKAEFALAGTALVIIAALAIVFVIRVTATLEELQSTAPSFAAEARVLIDQGNLTNALEKIRYAVKLAPDNAEYRYREASILQTLCRFTDARDAYSATVRMMHKSDLAARNLALCEELLREQANGASLQGMLERLRAALVEQGRVGEAIIVGQRIDATEEGFLDKWRARLGRSSFAGVLKLSPGGGLDLDASRTSATNLDALQGMPLTRLDVSFTSVSDLSPLRGMALELVNLEETGVADLSPLTGMPLRDLNISGTKVPNLSSLKGMQILHLIAQRLPIRDLTPLKGMPLRYLNLHNCREISDIRPLAGMMLHHIDLYHSRVSDVSVFRGMPLEGINLTATLVSDLTPLQGLPLSYLEVEATPVSDITPLQGLRLTNLILRGTRIRDIRPLQGMPLKALALDACADLEDLTPVSTCRELELLTIPSAKPGLEALRRMPKLKKLSYSISNSHDWDLMSSTSEFWQAYDSRLGAGR